MMDDRCCIKCRKEVILETDRRNWLWLEDKGKVCFNCLIENFNLEEEEG